MHLIVPFAAPSPAAVLPDLPNLAALLARMQATERLDGDAHTLNAPHERAWARAVGLGGSDGLLPLAAVAAARDGVALDARPVGLLTPLHAQIGRERVIALDPARLALDEAASRAVFDALAPLFADDDATLLWGAPTRWYLQHDELDGLACASLDRVVGSALDAWLPPAKTARRWRRLQAEAQMLLHTLPLNAQREAAGLLAVNSVWLSGCGRAQPWQDEGVAIEPRLRDATWHGDPAGWASAWAAVDGNAIAALLARIGRGEPAALTLCGERAAQRFEPAAPPWWRRFVAPKPAAVAPVLEAL
jgi:hypothetical protein